jgi:protein tyrosine phosphatase (PTP) superfamily phosphohydrolase (DUF442 family)
MLRAGAILLGVLLAAVAPPALLSEPGAASRVSTIPVGNRTAVELPGLHNVFRLSETLYSGGAPEGDTGFRSLRQLGIRTVLSVDGARPDVARARRFGMRYAHIPFGYDGCPDPTANRVVRAVRDLPGPIYLHCHHGKHRSPTAAAFARIALDGISNDAAVREMERAGTGKGYVGLYGDVRRYRPPSPAELDRVPSDFPEVAPTPPLIEAMVRIEQRFEGLQRCRKAGWRAPRDHRDLKPAHEALQLRELFTELQRTPAVRGKPADHRAWMRASERDAQALEAALRAREHARASLLLDRIGVTCGACHATYRNVPRHRVRPVGRKQDPREQQ